MRLFPDANTRIHDEGLPIKLPHGDGPFGRKRVVKGKGHHKLLVHERDASRSLGQVLPRPDRNVAQAYFNEEGVGATISKTGTPREKLFLTTKVLISNEGEEKAAASIDDSLAKLGTSYIDLLLIHQPFSNYYGTWRAMEKALASGKARAIGVSNFYPDRLADLCDFAEMALRFLLQRDVVVIPKSVHLARMRENIDVFDFELDTTDMDAISALDKERSEIIDLFDPATVEYLAGFAK